LSRITTGKPKARPRGRPFPKGVSGNPGGRPAQGPDRRKIEADARLLARSCGPEAVEELRTIMKDPAAPYMAKIIAANSLLDRGWGRPPVSVEVYEAVARPQEREGSAREIIESRLAELGARLRAEENPPKLLTDAQRVADPA
jgi:hypothetical protein